MPTSKFGHFSPKSVNYTLEKGRFLDARQIFFQMSPIESVCPKTCRETLFRPPKGPGKRKYPLTLVFFKRINHAREENGEQSDSKLLNGTREFSKILKFPLFRNTEKVALHFRKCFPENILFHSIPIQNFRTFCRMENAQCDTFQASKRTSP